MTNAEDRTDAKDLRLAERLGAWGRAEAGRARMKATAERVLLRAHLAAWERTQRRARRVQRWGWGMAAAMGAAGLLAGGLRFHLDGSVFLLPATLSLALLGLSARHLLEA